MTSRRGSTLNNETSEYSNPTPDVARLAEERQEVQKKTFTRWTNHFLGERMLKVEDLFSELSDGIKLINLLEIISSKSLGSYDKKPKMELQKLGNLNIALEFIKREGLKLVNIGAKDIHDAVSPKLILGLIWTLILRYTINLGGDGSSPKAALLEWVNNQIKPYQKFDVNPVQNFDKHWQDGRVICALADSISPGLINVQECKQPMVNWQKALDKSQEAFEIPQLVDAVDCVNNPEEHSIMTYVSYFRDYLENKAKDDEQYKLKGPRAENCFATGKGVMQPGPCFTKRPLPFDIFGRNKDDQPVFGKWGPAYTVAVTGPGGSVPCDVKECEDSLHRGSYTVDKPGSYKVAIQLDGRYSMPTAPIKGSTYHVEVKECTHTGNSYAQGPGLTSCFDDTPARFTVYLKDCNGQPVVGEDMMNVDIKLTNKAAPSSAIGAIAAAGQSDQVPVKVTDKNDGTYAVEYRATTPGDYLINVSVNKEAIRDMPSKMTCSKGVCGANTWAEGRGVSSPGFIDRKMPFTIHTHDPDNCPITSGGAEFKCTVTGPNGPVPCVLKDNCDGTYSGCYEPKDLGNHVVDIRVDKGHRAEPIRDNPFRITCKKGADPETSWAEGEGLTSASDNRPAFFTVHAIDEDGKPVSGEWVSVKLAGKNGQPVSFPLDIIDNNDGTYAVKYQANQPGDYTLVVAVNDQPIKDMPTKLHVHPGVDASQTVVTGPGVEGGTVNKDLPFTIFAKDKNGKPVEKGGDTFVAQVQGPAGPVPCRITDNRDGTYGGVYHPTAPGTYTVNVFVNGESGPTASAPAATKVVTQLVPVSKFCESCGSKLTGVKFCEACGEKIPMKEIQTVVSAPAAAAVGNSQATQTTVGKSPYKLIVKPGGDPLKSYAKGSGWRYAYDNAPAKFKVYVKDEHGKPVSGEKVRVVLVDKSSAEHKSKIAEQIRQVDPYMLKKKEDMNTAARAERKAAGEKVEADEGDVPVSVVDHGDGSYTVSYVAPRPGEFLCSVSLDAGHIQQSPKMIPVHWSCPNKPCAHTQSCLHEEIRKQRDEIYQLKKELAALKGQRFTSDPAFEDGQQCD